MIPVQDIYNATYNIIRFSQVGDLSVDEWNTLLATVENQLYTTLRNAGLKDSEAQMNLMPFRSVYQPPQTVTGIYSYPSDYFEYISVGCSVGVNKRQIPVNVLADAKWSARSTSKLVNLSKNPILLLADTDMQLLPETAILNMVYYKTITNAVYGATYNGDDEPIYDAGTSVDSMFMPSMYNTIVDMIIIEASKSLRDNDLLQSTTQTLSV